MAVERRNGRARRRGHGPQVTSLVRRNIQALVQERQELDRERRLEERVADTITRFTGSMPFVYFHALFFGGWILVNTGVLRLKPFDPFPFVMLAMIASVEAIFLSTFVLISQNRMNALDALRNDLDVQIDLLAEHEITRLIQMVDAIAHKLDVPVPADDLAELEQDVKPEAVLDELEQAERRR